MTPEQKQKNEQTLQTYRTSYSAFIRSELKLSNYQYSDLVKLLSEKNYQITETNLATKISRGMPAALFLLILDCLESENKKVVEILGLAKTKKK